MRILHILDHSLPHQSGYVYRTMSIMAAQKAMGWEPVLFTTPRHGKGTSLADVEDGWTIHRTPNEGAPSWLPTPFAMLREMQQTATRLEALIPEVKPDILHAHSPVLNFFPGNKARGALPIVYEVRAFWEDAAVDHGTTKTGSLRYRMTRALETRAFRKATAVTTICEGLRSDIAARGIAEDKITVIPNAVDTDKFPPIEVQDEALAASLGLQGKTVLGFIGSFYAYEGLEFLIRALPRLIARRPDVALLLVGGGPTDAALKAAVADLGLENHVIFTGRVPHSEVRRYYSLCDIMVYPRHSIRLTETVTPLKPLEAMAMKRLVLASDIGGHRELIDDSRTGRLFRADDAESFADVCHSLIEDRATWPEILAAGRDFVCNVRNWRNSVANYADVYARCLNTGAKP
ncbi:TIGR04063 family PEP-CTERM/XrtA system glycosyltransferase [Kordiimonas gwangyangensis]|uniref:TIGR04063 family PEP-CTERM/XrtA system glycosyltransferase n=1 Tax=Kordiimonas gwangyangensis TaxID=288022 RepID=UPI0003AA8EC8|nr:TIGR04063 family PEP-CTERM/XrtA system glycosyltransferase [Kordiimonas gwangyangensis]